MEIDATTSLDDTDETSHIISNSSVLRKNRFRKFFGFPKIINGKQTDDEQCSWCMSSHLFDNRCLVLFQLTIHFFVHVSS